MAEGATSSSCWTQLLAADYSLHGSVALLEGSSVMGLACANSRSAAEQQGGGGCTAQAS